MRFGFLLPNLLSPISQAHAIRTSARLAEAVGFDSIWATDHILMPQQYPQYGDGTESLVTLAYLAAATQRVSLGLSVLVLPLRNPLTVAKQIASIMHLSGRAGSPDAGRREGRCAGQKLREPVVRAAQARFRSAGDERFRR